jgi:hypothetical protein
VHITTTYHPLAGDPGDYPVGSQSSMPDSMCIFDDIFVPNELVFLDGQTAQAAVFAHSLGHGERLGGTPFMVMPTDELVGLAQLIAEVNGLARISHVREKIDEVTIHATLLRAGLEAALSNARATPDRPEPVSTATVPTIKLVRADLAGPLAVEAGASLQDGWECVDECGLRGGGSGSCGAMAAASIWTGLRQWRGVGRPLSYWLRNGLMDAESRAGYDCGSLGLGLMSGFMAILCACADGAVRGLHPGKASAAFWFNVVAVAGVIVLAGLFTGKMYRPRFLVPPHLRGEPGAIAGRRRRRREHLPMT